jgi:hypothetical protein
MVPYQYVAPFFSDTVGKRHDVSEVLQSRTRNGFGMD